MKNNHIQTSFDRRKINNVRQKYINFKTFEI